jgi:hypothetical protein
MVLLHKRKQKRKGGKGTKVRDRRAKEEKQEWK